MSAEVENRHASFPLLRRHNAAGSCSPAPAPRGSWSPLSSDTLAGARSREAGGWGLVHAALWNTVGSQRAPLRRGGLRSPSQTEN
ncbi:hypothetical protein AAFF_G00099830 [Aldrovandia affinis]|uniref:Uncharacterized protein n=1 Tax=Aldrovandia affinis TaxID=143900 RepID=A0AAD7WBC0_9TELE|nr:hypothetical protein AAFF_G00099830 [Aldrovandia affinis]